jgi:molecular chaperone GrpE (heat shock protein)
MTPNSYFNIYIYACFLLAYPTFINAYQIDSNNGIESYIYNNTDIGIENSNKVYGKIEGEINKKKESEEALKKSNLELQKEFNLLKDTNAQLFIQISSINDEKKQIEQLYKDAQTLFKEENNKNRINYDLLLALLSITTLVSIIISFWLYRWRRVVIAGNMPVVPETFSQQVNDIVLAVKNSSSKLGSVVNQQSNAVGQSSNSLALLSENIKEMIEVHMKLQSTLDQKEDEINRYKEGYDAKIFHNFLLRFTRVDRTFNDYIKDDNVDETVRDALEDIREMMEDALAECGVEAFSPEKGLNYKTAEGVADNPKTIDTDDESKHFTIAEVLDEGYRRETDSGFKVITQAKVSIFVYKKLEQENNN